MNFKIYGIMVTVLLIVTLVLLTVLWSSFQDSYPLTVEIDENKMIINGDISINGENLFYGKLDANPHVDTIVLAESFGGDSFAAMEMGYEIRERGLNTYLKKDSWIASSSVDLFLSGVERTIEKGACMGVHSWYVSDVVGFFNSPDIDDLPDGHSFHNLFKVYTKDMLGDDDFYWFSMKIASPDDLYFLTENDIREFQLGKVIGDGDFDCQ